LPDVYARDWLAALLRILEKMILRARLRKKYDLPPTGFIQPSGR